MTRGGHVALHRALDEARFGPARTLDLRASLPTGSEAVQRAEPWLRERQMAKAGTVLVITGRGKGSPGGVGVVHAAIAKLLGALRRKGVVSSVSEHTPGSFAVTLAPIRALFETTRRSRHRPERSSPADPETLLPLGADTRASLRRLAERALDSLGAPHSDRFVADEMLRQFSILNDAIAPDETDRESRLAFLITAASSAYDDGA